MDEYETWRIIITSIQSFLTIIVIIIPFIIIWLQNHQKKREQKEKNSFLGKLFLGLLGDDKYFDSYNKKYCYNLLRGYSNLLPKIGIVLKNESFQLYNGKFIIITFSGAGKLNCDTKDIEEIKIDFRFYMKNVLKIKL